MHRIGLNSLVVAFVVPVHFLELPIVCHERRLVPRVYQKVPVDVLLQPVVQFLLDIGLQVHDLVEVFQEEDILLLKLKGIHGKPSFGPCSCFSRE